MVPEVDKICAHAEKSYEKAIKIYELGIDRETAEAEAYADVVRELSRIPGWEYKFNTVASSRGDYPFITVTAGIEHTFCETCNDFSLNVVAADRKERV